eukprot:3179744-Pyramimonas_sp.AAC.1
MRIVLFTSVQKDDDEKVEAAPHPRNSPLAMRCNEGGVSQLRSVVGAPSWVTRRCRPGLLYR